MPDRTRTTLRSRLTYANAMSTIAVMIALGGTSYAATQLGRGSVTSRAIKDGAVRTADLANGAVTNRKLANKAVTGSKIAGATVTGSNIASATVTGSNIASATVTGSNIAGATVTGTNIASGSLTGRVFKCQPGDVGLGNRNLCFFDLHASAGVTWVQAVQMCRARGSTPGILASPAEIAAAAPVGGSPFHSVLLWSGQIASSTGSVSTASAWAVQTDANGNITLIVSTPLASTTIQDIPCVYHAADVF